ncbi:hypothetical protein HPB50_016524 [Hyalomma asiaticum]|uniref:Uncharacterized protein n=1 Tax=Hyalomma asiaticum TaxID=266040 RepID=A0ACB7RUK7_HYAAI|nr:hypothetical protein HPB50_016524 [Hyalomma asiaticum]
MVQRRSSSPLRCTQSSAKACQKKRRASFPSHGSLTIAPPLKHSPNPQPGTSQEMPLPGLFVAVPDQSATEGAAPSSAEVPFGYLDGHAAAGGDWLSTPPSSPLVSTLPPHGYIAAPSIFVTPTYYQHPAFPCAQPPPPSTTDSDTTLTTGKYGDTFKPYYPLNQAHLVELTAFEKLYMVDSHRYGPPEKNTCSKTVPTASDAAGAALPSPSLDNIAAGRRARRKDADSTSAMSSD